MIKIWKRCRRPRQVRGVGFVQLILSGEPLISDPEPREAVAPAGTVVLSPTGVTTPAEYNHPLRLYWDYLSYLFRKPPLADPAQLMEVTYRDYLQVQIPPAPTYCIPIAGTLSYSPHSLPSPRRGHTGWEASITLWCTFLILHGIFSVCLVWSVRLTVWSVCLTKTQHLVRPQSVSVSADSDSICIYSTHYSPLHVSTQVTTIYDATSCLSTTSNCF
jgi:hypothetical protein